MPEGHHNGVQLLMDENVAPCRCLWQPEPILMRPRHSAPPLGAAEPHPVSSFDEAASDAGSAAPNHYSRLTSEEGGGSGGKGEYSRLSSFDEAQAPLGSPYSRLTSEEGGGSGGKGEYSRLSSFEEAQAPLGSPYNRLEALHVTEPRGAAATHLSPQGAASHQAFSFSRQAAGLRRSPSAAEAHYGSPTSVAGGPGAAQPLYDTPDRGPTGATYVTSPPDSGPLYDTPDRGPADATNGTSPPDSGPLYDTPDRGPADATNVTSPLSAAQALYGTPSPRSPAP